MSETPQFGTAEYQPQAGNVCKTCEQAIAETYYRVNGAMTCAACADTAARQLNRDTGPAFARALLFGIGGALLGLTLYSAVGIITGLEIGYVSLAIGYVVGRAMMMGSRGVGGKRYQIAAVALTYAAISLSIVPVAIAQYGRSKGKDTKETAAITVNSTDASAADITATPAEASDTAPLSAVGIVFALVYLIGFGLLSPVLNLASPLQGLLGLIILSVGLRIAWQTTAGPKLAMSGPFKAVNG